MEHFNLIGELKNSAHNLGWFFAAGDNFSQNIAIAEENLTAGQLVLTVKFNAYPTIRGGRVQSIRYVGPILLGRKQEVEGTESSLDEDYIDKYERRLLELTQRLVNFIGEFACNNELDVSNIEIAQSLNNFSTNVDFVGGNITLIQE